MDNKKPLVGIIGAGFSGICAAIKLQKDLPNASFVIFDENKDVGGTWLVNTYPGCECDVPSHLYSYSFELNPYWSSTFASQSEILQYIQNVAKKYGLYEKIKFNRQVKWQKWDEENSCWHLEVYNKETQQTEEYSFPFLLSAVGALRYPHTPKQFDDFEGIKIHSAEWKDTIDFKNKKVGVVGSGASAIQIVPAIEEKMEGTGELHSFQRKPGWVNPKSKYNFHPAIIWIFANIPFIMWLYRAFLFLRSELRFSAFIPGTFIRVLAYKFANWNRNRELDDHNRKLLTPNYELGCKRILLSDNYFQTFKKPNVHVHTSNITKVTKDSITTEDGVTQKLDILILATGFKVQEYFAPMKVYGRNGVDILELWKKEMPRTYYGMASSYDPNMLALLGPNTGLGHNSIIFMIECQVNFIIQVLKEALRRKAKIFVIKKEAEDEWTEKVQKDMKSTIWGTASCASWYANEKGEITALWPNSCMNYYFNTKNADLNAFQFIK